MEQRLTLTFSFSNNSLIELHLNPAKQTFMYFAYNSSLERCLNPLPTTPLLNCNHQIPLPLTINELTIYFNNHVYPIVYDGLF